jgi:hypothetical protein
MGKGRGRRYIVLRHLALAGSLLLVLTGCGGQDQESNASGKPRLSPTPSRSITTAAPTGRSKSASGDLTAVADPTLVDRDLALPPLPF